MSSSVASTFLLCYHARVAVTKIADAKADREHWLTTRMGYLTSSEIFAWRGEMSKATAKWWSDDQESVLAGKSGAEKEFDVETETSIWHGIQDEESVQAKFGYAVGCDVKPENGLYTNDRFPGIAASIDGFGRPAGKGTEMHEAASQDRALIPYLRDYIDVSGCMFITEIKKSTSSKWQTQVPEYNIPQVKTQLSVLEMPYAIIVADTLKRGDTQKWRWYWDMQAYVIEYDPAWDEVLEREGQKFLTINK